MALLTSRRKASTSSISISEATLPMKVLQKIGMNVTAKQYLPEERKTELGWRRSSKCGLGRGGTISASLGKSFAYPSNMSSAAPALSEKTQKLVDQWLSWDKNAKNREEIQTLAQKGDEVELNKILGKRIAFGTAGSSTLPSRKRRRPLLSVRFAPPSMFGTIQTQPFMSHMVGESFLVSGSFVFCGLPIRFRFVFLSVCVSRKKSGC